MLDRREFLKNSALATSAIFKSDILLALEKKDDDKASIIFTTVLEKTFSHGVASGDPSNYGFTIWTRIISDGPETVSVKWSISKDINFLQLIQAGELTTDSRIDYTVKVDVQNLIPSTSYYYKFRVGDFESPIGRTKTTPSDNYENIKLAVVSCSNYSAGYYNAYSRVADRNDLDAVIHLGDYIYEGTERSFDPRNLVPEDDYEATHFNRNRNWWLHYYRRRYSVNRTDPNLQAAHQAHPFITVWDDHEIANNAWKDGAQGHNPETDGEWEDRKSAARQAYAEWMPIRGDASKIYRSITYGKIAELILLDTRLEGRDQQIYDSESPDLFAPNRTILGKDQKEWLFQRLDKSACQWKLVVNQVVFSEFNVKWANFGGQFSDKVQQLQNTLLDYWEGYPAERDEVVKHISSRKINNVIILSASMHCALAFDVTMRASNYSRRKEKATYDPITGNGSVAVEFAATSITSENFDEKMGRFYASTFESLINKKLPPPLNYNPNPHLKFADLQRHGYFILKLSKEKAEADFYFVDHLTANNTKESLGASWHTKAGRNRLERSKLSFSK